MNCTFHGLVMSWAGQVGLADGQRGGLPGQATWQQSVSPLKQLPGAKNIFTAACKKPKALPISL
jgi:hypothetical protein